MKKFLKLMFVFLFMFLSLVNVKAKETNWEEICREYEKFLNNENYKFVYDENSLTIFLTNEKFGDYSISFNYNDGVISYENNRDVSSASDDLKIYYDNCDSYFIFNFFLSICNLYQVDPNLDVSEDENLKYGFDTEQFSSEYHLSDGSSVTATSTKSMTFDLEKFNTETLEYQNSENSSEYYFQLRDFFTSFINPMGGLPSSDDFFSTFGDLFEEIQSEGSESKEDSNLSKKDTNINKEVVKVPSTGINSKFIVFGVLILSISIGSIVYFVILKHN